MDDDEMPLGPVHVFDGERCIHCGVNVYDSMLYGPEDCIDYAERKTVWTFEEGRNDMEAAEAENDQMLREYQEKRHRDDHLSDSVLSAHDRAEVEIEL